MKKKETATVLTILCKIFECVTILNYVNQRYLKAMTYYRSMIRKLDVDIVQIYHWFANSFDFFWRMAVLV